MRDDVVELARDSCSFGRGREPDLLLFVGDRLSRVAGRNQIDPEPARRTMLSNPARTPIGGPPERTTG